MAATTKCVTLTLPNACHLAALPAPVAPVVGAAPEPEYHNYLMEGVLGVLQWIQGLLVPGSVQQGVSTSSSGSVQSLTEGAERLRALSEQLREVSVGLDVWALFVQHYLYNRKCVGCTASCAIERHMRAAGW